MFGGSRAPVRGLTQVLTLAEVRHDMSGMHSTYYVRAVWDDEAGVYYSDTNIPGLNIEAETLPEFIEAAQELAPQMLEANVEGFRPDIARARPTAELAIA